jgi:class 3 adenylate cyclase/tetratricopeptide (TPR) repeat protein
MAGTDQDAARIRAAIAALEAQRPALGNEIVEPALAALRSQLAQQSRTTGRDTALDGDRRAVTVMFADLSGFTALSEHMDPEAVRTLVNACFRELVPIVERYDGTIDKFIGDEIMALFGAPSAHENDPERALRAALEMRAALADFNRRFGVDLGLHFGVNTGPVIAGMIGSEDRREYSVMGDAVNLASRLADASERGEILIGSETYRHAAPLFDFEPADRLAVKGKGEPVVVHKLKGLKAEPRVSRGIEGLSSPLVGRDEPLDRLRTALARVGEGRGGVVAIRGEAGVGKSRLVAEVQRSHTDGLDWAEGRCLSFTQGTSYAPARGLLYDLIGVRPDDSLVRIESALRTSVRDACSEEGREVFPYLARLLDVPLSASEADTLTQLTTAVLHARTLGAFQVFLRARAARRPLVLAWEDLHWADPSTLQLLKTLLPIGGEAPLLLLLAYRLEDGPIRLLHDELTGRWSGLVEAVELTALDAEDSLTLFSNLLDVGSLAPTVRKAILERADGNPFFLEELVRALIDSDILASADPSAVRVPTTIGGVLMARIDGLEPQSRQTLQSAAVVGRVFHRSVLRRVVAPDGLSDGLDTAVTELLRREFIRHRPEDGIAGPAGGDAEFIFKHAVTQDVAYESLLITRRKALHERVGRAMEHLFAGRLDEVAAELAYHFAKAEATTEAVQYFTRAGDRAKAAYANAEAGEFYRQALDQIDRARDAGEPEPNGGWAPTEAHLHEHLADLLELTGRHEAARESYLRALARTGSDVFIDAGRRRRKWGLTFMVERRFDEALDGYGSAEKTLGAAPPDDDPAWWAEWVLVQLEFMWVFYWQGRVEELQARAEASLAAVERRGSPDQRARYFMMLALSNLRRDRYVTCDQTLEYAEAAVAALQASPSLGEHGHVGFVLGFARLWRGDLGPAVEAFTGALRMAERVGDVVIQVRCLTYLMTAARLQGRLEDVRRLVPRVETLAADLKMVEYMAMAKAATAWLAGRSGTLAEARTAAREALDAWHRMPVPYSFDWMAVFPLAGVSLAAGETAEAVAQLRTLLEPGQQPLPEALDGLVRTATESWNRHDPEHTRLALDDVATVARQLGYL